MTQSLAMAATARRDPPDPWMPVIGAATAKLIATARVFAARGEIVLISGPTGSGKSRLAHWCHQQSPRRDQRFETLDLRAEYRFSHDWRLQARIENLFDEDYQTAAFFNQPGRTLFLTLSYQP